METKMETIKILEASEKMVNNAICALRSLAPSQAMHVSGLSLPAFIMGLATLVLKFLNLLLTGCSLQESLLQCLPALLAFLTSLKH